MNREVWVDPVTEIISQLERLPEQQLFLTFLDSLSSWFDDGNAEPRSSDGERGEVNHMFMICLDTELG